MDNAIKGCVIFSGGVLFGCSMMIYGALKNKTIRNLFKVYAVKAISKKMEDVLFDAQKDNGGRYKVRYRVYKI